MISVDASALLITALVFALVVVLKSLFFEPLARAMEQRQARIDKAANAWDVAQKNIESARSQVREAVQQARNDGYDLLDEARSEALTQSRADIDKSRTDAQAELQAAKNRLSAETTEAVKKMEQDARALANDIASRILGRSLA